MTSTRTTLTPLTTGAPLTLASAGWVQGGRADNPVASTVARMNGLAAGGSVVAGTMDWLPGKDVTERLVLVEAGWGGG